MSASGTDREAGTISLSKDIYKGKVTLTVLMIETDGTVQVTSSANRAGDFGIIGISAVHEDQLRKFHAALSKILKLTSQTDTDLRVEQVR